MLTPGALPYMGGTPMPFATGMAPGTPVPDVAKTMGPVQPDEEQQQSEGLGSFSMVGNPLSADNSLVPSPECSPSVGEAGLLQDELSETTEEKSVQSSSESDSEELLRAPRPFVEIPSDYVINNKSLVLHLIKAEGLLACGRKLTQSYSKIFELNGIRCSRCFNV